MAQAARLNCPTVLVSGEPDPAARMPVIHLVRHAQPDFQGNYDSLTSLGYEQARWLGNHYAALGLGFDRIYAGSLVRQTETARAVSGCLSSTPDLVVDARFNEYDVSDVLGGYAGQADVALRATGDRRTYFTAVRNALLAWSAAEQHPGARESWLQFGIRIEAAFDECHRGLPRDGRVLIVTSGGVIGRLVARTLGADATTAIALNLQARNTGISELVVGSSATRLVQFNAIPHLERADRVHAQTYS
jgi:broad specificity phosphatase PhoE